MLTRELFNETGLRKQAARISQAWPGFDSAGFLSQVLPTLETLQLKERSDLICQGLQTFLPPNFAEAQAILLKSLPPKIKGPRVARTEGLICLPIGDYVAAQGQAFFELSMELLHQLTQCFTAEMAIRPFLVSQPQATLQRLQQWANDPSVHVRRLVSEGTRPRLPWASQLKAFIEDPGPTLDLLKLLVDDPELYVRRSVANHLNDISKDHPQRVVAWLKEQLDPNEPRDRWIIRHSLRSLIKKADSGALALLGFVVSPELKLSELSLSCEHIRVGEDLEFSFSLTSRGGQNQKLSIDFVVEFVKANGSLAPKVFKLSVRTLAPGQTLRLKKTFSFLPRNTRKLYPGKHLIYIQVGQLEGAKKPFHLR